VGASTAAIDAVEATAVTFVLPSRLLRPGRNVLAASVHNAALDSSDLSFQAVVMEAPADPRPVLCGNLLRRGDVSGDGSTDVADAVSLLLFLFAGGDEPVCADSADADDDGAIRVTDAVSLLRYLFRGGPAPAAPGPVCGEDPTADALGECVAPECGR
jgi:hypothetical protein